MSTEILPAVSLPMRRQDYTPNFPMLEPRKLNWIGRFVFWLKANEARGFIGKVLILDLTFLIVVGLTCSAVGIPLLVWGLIEERLQRADLKKQEEFKELQIIACDYAQQKFLKGRLDPLKRENFQLSPVMRKHLIQSLDPKPSEDKSDNELVQMAALANENFREAFNLPRGKDKSC